MYEMIILKAVGIENGECLRIASGNEVRMVN